MEERLLTYGVVGLLFIALAIQIITGRALLPGVNPERDEQAGLYWVSIAAWGGAASSRDMEGGAADAGGQLTNDRR